jgi:hypothetical protein
MSTITDILNSHVEGFTDLPDNDKINVVTKLTKDPETLHSLLSESVDGYNDLSSGGKMDMMKGLIGDTTHELKMGIKGREQAGLEQEQSQAQQESEQANTGLGNPETPWYQSVPTFMGDLAKTAAKKIIAAPVALEQNIGLVSPENAQNYLQGIEKTLPTPKAITPTQEQIGESALSSPGSALSAIGAYPTLGVSQLAEQAPQIAALTALPEMGFLPKVIAGTGIMGVPEIQQKIQEAKYSGASDDVARGIGTTQALVHGLVYSLPVMNAIEGVMGKEAANLVENSIADKAKDFIFTMAKNGLPFMGANAVSITR